jgi:hypothetical protein
MKPRTISALRAALAGECLVGMTGAIGGAGCARSPEQRPMDQAVEVETHHCSLADFRPRGISPLRVGEARVLDSHNNPMLPVHLVSDGSSIAVSFGEAGRGRREAFARVDPGSLQLLSRQETGRSEEPSAPSTVGTRVELDDGRYLVSWTQASPDGDRYAVAQMERADGSRLGAPVVLSPRDADVFGAPHAVSTDGQRVVVTFAAASGESFELRAVLLDVNSSQDDYLYRAVGCSG